MKLTENINELQKLLNYVVIRKSLRWSGIWGIVFGAIYAAVTIPLLKEPDIFVFIMLALGVFLIAEGLWLVINPSPVSILVDGITFVVLAVWNVGTTVLAIYAGGDGSENGRGIIGAIIQLAIAGREFSRYKYLKKQPPGVPSNINVEKATQMLKEVIDSTALLKEPDVLMINSADLLKRSTWKVKLYENAMLFVDSKWQMAIVDKIENISIETIGSTEKTNIKITVKTSDYSFKGTMSQLQYGKYKAWKNAPVDTENK